MEYYAVVKKEEEETLTFYDSSDRLGENYAKWIKPVSERQIPHDRIYMWNLMNTINK